METATLYIKPRLSPLAWLRARSYPALLLLAATLLIVVTPPTLKSAALAIFAAFSLAYLSPPIRWSSIPSNLLVSVLSILSALLISWQSEGSRELYTLKSKLELLCTMNHLWALGVLWVLAWALSLAVSRRDKHSDSYESERRTRIRRNLFRTLLVLTLAQLWVFSQPHLGPVECPDELLMKNLRRVTKVSFQDPRVEAFAPTRVPDSPWLASLQVQQREQLHKAAIRCLNDPNYSFGDQELYLVYLLLKDLDQVPVNHTSCELSAAALAFARRHQREFLWGPELRYFWRHTLPYVATHPFTEDSYTSWSAYQAPLHLQRDTEICSLRYFSDWTCARSSMTLFGRKYATSPRHFWLETRVRWTSLLLDVPDRERSLSKADPESHALSAVLNFRRGRKAHNSMTVFSFEDRDGQELHILNPDSPPIFRPSLSLRLGSPSEPIESESGQLPESPCRCERDL